MKAALISPTNLLEETQQYSQYHLVLTHKVIYDRRYRDFYAARSLAGDYVILDNSAAEKKGRSFPLNLVVLAANLIKPDVVFLPDVLFEGEKTADEVEKAVESAPLRFLKSVQPSIKLGVVVQGLDPQEWLEHFSIVNGLPGIDLLGIPMLTSHVFGSRVTALKKIAKRAKTPCHLLGAWHSCTLDEIREEAHFPFVMGIDTTKPIKLAVQGKKLEQWGDYQRDKNYIDKDWGNVDMALLHYNCQRFTEICKNGGA